MTVWSRTVPLARPWGSDVPANHVIICEVTLDDGRRGTGFGWTPQIGAGAVRSLLETEVRDAALGLPAHPEVVWDLLWRHLREAGAGGIPTIALAAIDLALWDLRRDGRGLANALGRRRDTVPVYGSGVNLHYSLEELVAQAGRWARRRLPGGQGEGGQGRPARGRGPDSRGPRGDRSGHAADDRRQPALGPAAGTQPAPPSSRTACTGSRSPSPRTTSPPTYGCARPSTCRSRSARASTRRTASATCWWRGRATSCSRTWCGWAGSPRSSVSPSWPGRSGSRLPAPAAGRLRAARPRAAVPRDGRGRGGRLLRRPRPARRAVPGHDQERCS